MAEHDLRAVAFPKLDEAQLAALGRCALTKLKQYRKGEKLFEAGEVRMDRGGAELMGIKTIIGQQRRQK